MPADLLEAHLVLDAAQVSLGCLSGLVPLPGEMQCLLEAPLTLRWLPVRPRGSFGWRCSAYWNHPQCVSPWLTLRQSTFAVVCGRQLTSSLHGMGEGNELIVGQQL